MDDGGNGLSLGPDWLIGVGGVTTGGGGGGASSTVSEIDCVVDPLPFAHVMPYEVDCADATF